MKKTTYTPRRIMRMMIIMIVYSYEIFNSQPQVNEIFEQDQLDEWFDYKEVFWNNANEIRKEQYKIFSSIEKNYELIIKNIEKHSRLDWKWERINPLLRSILICASIELWNLDIGIVANEYTEITKDFFTETDEYKFVNKIVEKIGKEYCEYKNQKKSQNNEKTI